MQKRAENILGIFFFTEKKSYQKFSLHILENQILNWEIMAEKNWQIFKIFFFLFRN